MRRVPSALRVFTRGKTARAPKENRNQTGLLRPLASDAAHRPGVVAVVVIGGVDTRSIEVQVVSVGIARRARRPVVAVVRCVVKRTAVHVAPRHKGIQGRI